MNETLQNLLHTHLPTKPTITHIEPVSESRAHRVWKITTQDKVFAVKHHLYAPYTRGKPYDLLAVEKRVTNHLLNAGISVPPIIASDSESSLVLYPWCGDQTVDDICQAGNPEPYVSTIIQTLYDTEKAFHNSNFSPYVAPGCTPEDLKEQWTHITDAVQENLTPLSQHITGTPLSSQQVTSWQTLLNTLSEIPPTLGLTDYNARNIVCHPPDTVTLLELAKIGYDWPERRLLQYTTSLGAHHPQGRIVSLITPSIAKQYASHAAQLYHTSSKTALVRLDAHHFIFHLLAIQMCINAQQDPDHPWKNIDTRIIQHTEQLAYQLSDDTTICTLREHFT